MQKLGALGGQLSGLGLGPALELNGAWMCMDEFVKRLYDFRGIYRIFWSQNSHY